MIIGICDDEAVAHRQVKAYIENIDFGVVFDIIDFESGKELLAYAGAIDILLLDIAMPELDGIEIGHRLKTRHNIGRIIMLTGMIERFPEAFEIEAYRFVKKPIERDRLIKAIREAVNTFLGCSPVEVYQNNQKYVLKQRQIRYISRLNSRTEVIIGRESFQSPMTLREWEEQLDMRLFLQVHKSYIVNLSEIDEIEEKIILKNGEIIPIARRRKNELRKQFMQYDLKYR